jgi:enoyl-CoA hydratase/carnithine racemase
MDEGRASVERDGEVAILRLDRPPVNALELGIATEMGRRLAEVEESDAGAIVLTGGGACFSAGLDLKVVPRYGPEDQRAVSGRRSSHGRCGSRRTGREAETEDRRGKRSRRRRGLHPHRARRACVPGEAASSLALVRGPGAD